MCVLKFCGPLRFLFSHEIMNGLCVRLICGVFRVVTQETTPQTAVLSLVNTSEGLAIAAEGSWSLDKNTQF